jgi:hypothetical protein
MIASKLVESWLDSQSERQYHSALVQLLIAEGWEVLHNTRHTALEFGKDVIARDPRGALYAIQLKGNPGGRVSKSEAQALLPQVREGLISFVPAAYQRKRNEKHTFVICTNGEIDEAAMVLFQNVAQLCGEPGTAAKGVEYWSRGNLLKRIGPKIEVVWPSNPKSMALALGIYTSDGLNLPNVIQVATALSEAKADPYKMTSARKRALIASTLLFAEVLKWPWRQTGDHYSLYTISILAAMVCVPLADSDDRSELISDYLRVAAGHARSLLLDAEEVRYDPTLTWARTSPLSEIDIMHERRRLIGDASAFLLLHSGQSEVPNLVLLRKILSSSFGNRTLWGQGVIPSMLLRFWAFRRLDATLAPEIALLSVLHSTVAAASRKECSIIANAAPYYGFEEVLYLTSGGIVGTPSDILEDSSFKRSNFAKPLFLMAAKRNLKQTCKALWRTYSNIMHDSLAIPEDAFFSPVKATAGQNSTEQLYSGDWRDQIVQANRLSDWPTGHWFSSYPALLAAYVALVPYRAQPPVIMFLDEALAATWYGKHHLPS